jgi:hypothetical protein
MRLTMLNRSKVLRASRFDPRYRHHVAEFEVFQHPQKLARVGPGGLSGAS